MTMNCRGRDFAITDAALRWEPAGTLRDRERRRVYALFTPVAPPAAEPAPAPEPERAVPPFRQAVDAVALTSAITGLIFVLRISFAM